MKSRTFLKDTQRSIGRKVERKQLNKNKIIQNLNNPQKRKASEKEVKIIYNKGIFVFNYVKIVKCKWSRYIKINNYQTG